MRHLKAEATFNHLLHIVQFVIVVDDENGDIEGNLVMAASLATPQAIAYMVKHGSGIVSVGMKEDDLRRLKLPLMSPETEDEDSSAPTFTITVVYTIPVFCLKMREMCVSFINLLTK